jgi:predicted dehydrogenase
MVEKPLAVSLAHAQAMQQLARKHKILLLTNYETTWYGSHARAFQMVSEKAVGPLRKIVVHSGHAGPQKIGVNQEFLDWLTDPVLNGGGALTDFGCYGANLATRLMGNQKPASVTAVTQQLQPDIYPHVEDEATIVLTYPHGQAVIQASWNWPFSRKDLEIYGQSGYVICVDDQQMRVRLPNQTQEQALTAAALTDPHDDPFAYLAAAVRGKLEVTPDELSSLENNMIVVEILAAAKASAQSGKTVPLD